MKRVQEQVQNIYNWLWNEYRRGTDHVLEAQIDALDISRYTWASVTWLIKPVEKLFLIITYFRERNYKHSSNLCMFRVIQSCTSFSKCVLVVIQFDLWYNFVLNQYKMF